MPVTTVRGGRQIADGTIPYVDIQNVTASRLLGNPTGSAATMSEISLSTGLEFNGSTLRTTANLRSLDALSYSSASFVKMTAAGTFALDTNSYITTSQTYYIGTTQNALNRSSGSQTLTGVSIDGNAATVTGFKNIGNIAVQAVTGSNQTCTTAQFLTWYQTNYSFKSYYYTVAKCTWDYAGNNDISDTSIGSCDMAGSVIETFSDGTYYTIRITRPTTGTGGFVTLVYNDQGSSYSPGWRTDWNSTNLTNLNQLTNGPGYTANTGTVTSVSGTGTVSGLTLTGTVTGSGSLTLGGTLSLTSGNVTTALGYTPYNATNPSGYITGVAWNDVTSKPSNIFYYEGWVNSPGYDANTIAENRSGFTYANNAPYNGPMVHFAASGYGLQLNGTYSGGGSLLGYRTRNGDTGSWNAWNSILHSGNYNSYSPTLTGGGASGSWGINITGTAAGETLSTVTGRGNTTTSIIGVTSESAGHDPYGKISVTRGTDSNFSYYGMTRSGSIGWSIGINTSNAFIIGTGASSAGVISTTQYSFSNGGTFTASGDVIAYGSPSDLRYKTIKDQIPDALQKIQKLNGYRFDWIKQSDVLELKEDIGVIAQEVAAVFPELARTNADGYMSVRYQGLTAVLIEAVKEQQKQIEDLQKQIKYLVENR